MNLGGKMEETIISLYLFYGAVRDVVTKKVPVWYLFLGGIIIILYSWDKKTTGISSYVYAMIPGLIFLLYRFIKKEGIGYADGIMLCFLGIQLGSEVWKVCCLSLVFISVFSLILLVLKKISLNTKLPYYPFLFGAYLVCYGVRYV